jgi:hypothetical protein
MIRHSSTSTAEEDIERVRVMILDNRRVTIDEVAHHLHTNQGSAHGIIQDLLQSHKFCALWVPKQFTGEYKCNHLTTCHSPLNCYHNRGDAHLSCTVTEAEMWIQHYAPESKHQSMEWRHQTSPVKRRFKTQPSLGNVTTLFCKAQEPILEHYQKRGITVNCVHYSEMCWDQLKPAV